MLFPPEVRKTHRLVLPLFGRTVHSCAVCSITVVSSSLWAQALQPAKLLCLGFSRQGHWSGLPSSPPGDLPNPGIEPRFPASQSDSSLSEPPGKPACTSNIRSFRFLHSWSPWIWDTCLPVSLSSWGCLKIFFCVKSPLLWPKFFGQGWQLPTSKFTNTYFVSPAHQSFNHKSDSQFLCFYFFKLT